MVEVRKQDTELPFHLQLHVKNEEGRWNQLRSFNRNKKKITIKTPARTHKILWWTWEEKEKSEEEEVFTETREDFFDRCIKEAKKLKREHNNRRMKLEDLWIHQLGEDVFTLWNG